MHAEEEMNRIQAEENRLLEAYRSTIISPAQLGQQLELLKARRAAIEISQSQLDPARRPLPREQIETQITAFCAQASHRLNSFTPEEWRRFLQTIIHRAVFDGVQIRIEGHIPAASSGERIATMAIDFHGHNTGWEKQEPGSTNLNGARGLPRSFQLVHSVVRQRHQQPHHGFAQSRPSVGRFTLA